MTHSDLIELRTFESDVRQLLKSYTKMKSELSSLQEELQQRVNEIERLERELSICRRMYSNLRTARILELSDSDIKESKVRITRLVREVNKCIRLLSAEVDEMETDEEYGTDTELMGSPVDLREEAKDDEEEAEESAQIEVIIDESAEMTEESEEMEEEEVEEEAKEEEKVEEEESEEKKTAEERAKEEDKAEEKAEEKKSVEENPSKPKKETDPWDFGMLPLFPDE